MTLDEKNDRQDASIKKMAKALRDGARMLDLACPVCNNPIFQVKTGEKFCVSCERKVMLESEVTGKADKNVHVSKNAPLPSAGASNNPKPGLMETTGHTIPAIVASLKEQCLEKLGSLVTKMGRTTDEGELAVLYSNTLKLLEILKQIGLF